MHPAAQRAGVAVQDFRCATFAFNHPIRLRQHRLDMAAFVFFEIYLLRPHYQRSLQASFAQ
jgi:hypothetical protein